MTKPDRATSLNSGALAYEDHSEPTASRTPVEFCGDNRMHRDALIPLGGAQ